MDHGSAAVCVMYNVVGVVKGQLYLLRAGSGVKRPRSGRLEIGQFQETIRRGEPFTVPSGRKRSERLSRQREFRRLHVRWCSSRCEVIEIHHWCVHAASENLMAKQIEKIQQRRTSRLVPPLRGWHIIGR